ncbi:MAG: chemotaxis protein methyltransferase [Geobacteraceae bacterium]|nr:MAG: chemotaxis protein methyltransferase [Geobacteraceae bacterium]
MTHTISDKLLAQSSEFITARFGLHFPKKRWRDLEQGIICAARDFGFADPAACVRWLLTAELTKEQINILAGCLTIGETYFFREQKSFEALENHILPELLGSRRGKEQRLRIWSAGCSTGEEPYSIGIMLQRLIADLPHWNVTILATDVNPASLRKGVQGEYGDWSFRGVPRGIKERYFTAGGTGRFAIAGAVRKMVTFAPLNLAEDTYPSLFNNTNAMDVIFCRNVLMYFSPEQAKRVIDKFCHSLVAGGWLIVSPTETSPTLFAGFETVHFHNAVFYRKDGHGKTAVAPSLEATGAMTAPPPPLPAVDQTGTMGFTPPQSAEPLPAAAQRDHAERQVSPYEEALALYRRGEYAEAAAKLVGFLANAPSGSASLRYGEAAALLAWAFANQGELSAALDWSEKAIAVNKLDPEVRYLQAIIFQEQGDDDAAIASLKRALYLDHGFVLAHFALANLTRRRGRTKEAARHLENAASLLTAYGDNDILPGSEGMSARRLGEIIASTREASSGSL